MQCRAWVGTNWAQEASSGFAVEAPKAANSIKAKEKFGGRDRDRTGDPLLAKGNNKIYLVGSLGFVLCPSPRFCS